MSLHATEHPVQQQPVTAAWQVATAPIPCPTVQKPSTDVKASLPAGEERPVWEQLQETIDRMETAQRRCKQRHPNPRRFKQHDRDQPHLQQQLPGHPHETQAETARTDGQLSHPLAHELTSSGSRAIDRLLPNGGFERGSLIEWLGPRQGGGAATLAMLAAINACSSQQGLLLVIDREQRFYPPACLTWGLEAHQLVIVRPESNEDELWALDQALRSPAIAAVWANIERIDERAFRRLQLAAELGGGLGFLIRPSSVRGRPSWSEVQLWVEPLRSPTLPLADANPSATPTGMRFPTSLSMPPRVERSIFSNTDSAEQDLSGCWRLAVQLLRVRRGHAGSVLELELDPLRRSAEPVCEPTAPSRHGNSPMNAMKLSGHANASRLTAPLAAARETADDKSPSQACLMRLAAQLAHPTPGRRAARA